MPMSREFEQRLLVKLPAIIEHFGTPFHILDEQGIIDTANRLNWALRACPDYRNFFAVKANSNPEVLKLVFSLGMGFDCSSPVELMLARDTGAGPEDIFCTSNNTSAETFKVAMADGGCILNLDDASFAHKVPDPFPEFICFRYNPGDRRSVESVIGSTTGCKYGIPHEQFMDAYRHALQRGAKRFGLHTMIVSNELDWKCHAETVQMLLGVAAMLEDELSIRVEFINIGGGLGIPYSPNEPPVALVGLKRVACRSLNEFRIERGWRPRLYSENGRHILGPNGVFVAKCINEMRKYREFRGVDASAMASIMRPPMYHPDGGYHHITVLEDPIDDPVLCSVVGPACEDSDRFGWDRELSLHEGQHVIVHDTGAHAIEMGNNYNNWPRSQALMLRESGQVDLVAPGETEEELLARRYQYLKDQYASLSFTP